MVTRSGLNIAVIGLGCSFPDAPDVRTFWKNIETGHDAIKEAPEERWEKLFYDPDSSAVDRIYSRRGGFLGSVADFDAVGFGLMPIAARGAEPDQLLALQVAAATFVDAGYEDRPFARDRAAVILGRGGYLTPGLARVNQKVRTANQIVQVLETVVPDLPREKLEEIKAEFQERSGEFGPDTAIGLVPNLAASRIANRLDLHGPAFTVDAACASALIAVDHGCRELVDERCDLVLAGGVHLVHDITFWSVFSQLGALSRSDQIRPFDRRADGLLLGEGIGMVLLKRLDDAISDGDQIYAVIRGVGVASDGRGTSVMQPQVEGQVLALHRAWEAAGLDPTTVGLVEGHGTATPAGDAAELATLARVFGAPNGERRAVLGSVKSMIGHTMPAAGAAGLIKAVLAVHHGVLPPTLHCEEPDPDLERTRFRVIATSERWEGASRVAAVNAFGFGGINAHVVVDAYGGPERRRRTRASSGDDEAPVVTLRAATPAALLVALDAGAWGSGEGPVRLAMVDPSEKRVARARRVVERGSPWRGRSGIWFAPSGLAEEGGKVVFVFPGVDASFEPRAEDVATRFGHDVPLHLRPRDLEETGQGIVEVNRLLDQVLRELGLVPDAVAGHSIGEWSAMIAGGLIPTDEADALLERLRPGSLEVPGVLFAAAACDVIRAQGAIEGLADITVSHDNCPHQVILCGKEESIEAARHRLVQDGVICQVLPFRSGFHSPLFDGYLAPHRERFGELRYATPQTPVWSATTCRPFPADPAAVKELAVRHLVSPVHFRQLVESLYEDGFRIFVQVGTGSLVGFIDDTLKDLPHLAVTANDPRRSGLAQLRRLGAALFVEGVPLKLERIAPASRSSAVPIALELGTPLVQLDAAHAVRTRPMEVRTRGSAVLEHFTETSRALTEAQGEVLTAFERFSARAEVAPRVLRRTLSVKSVPSLLDHCFYPQPRDWPVLVDRRPVAPMTMTIDLLVEAARPLFRDQVPIAVEELVAQAWIEVEPPVEVEVHARPDGPDTARVSIEGFAAATIRFAQSFPPPPPDRSAKVTGARPTPIDARTLYADRWMFHGPAYQGITQLGPLGDDGIDGIVTVPPGPGALLDNAGQLFGYWVMATRDTDRLAMPIGIERLAFYSDAPGEGEEVRCRVRITHLTPTEVRCDMVLLRDGVVWAEIDSWTDHRFPNSPALWEVLRQPEVHVLSEERDDYVFYDDSQTTAPSRDWLIRRYLGHDEREEMLSAGPRRQREFLHGRIAAKDAVRRLLWEGGHGPLFPGEVRIVNDPGGRPSVVGFAERDLHVSLAHSGEVAVAIASEGREVGIDVEHIVARGESFERTALTDAERALIGERPSDEWVTRMWCAKEALGKARGTGLRGVGRSLPVTAVDGERVQVDGVWVETRLDGPHAVAWVLI